MDCKKSPKIKNNKSPRTEDEVEVRNMRGEETKEEEQALFSLFAASGNFGQMGHRHDDETVERELRKEA